MKNGALTPRAKKFIELYLTNGKNATDAYVRSAPKPLTIPKEKIRIRAHYFTRQPNIKALIQAAEAREVAAVEKVLDKYQLSRERVAQELVRVAFTNASDVMTWSEDGIKVKSSEELTPEAHSAVAEVTETVVKDGKNIVRVKNYDKVGALVALGKELGMFKEKQDVQQHMNVQFVIEKG